MTTPQDTPDVLSVVTQAAAEALYGAGAWPFNAATGYVVEAEATHMANYLLADLAAAGYRIIEDDPLGLDVDTSAIDPEAEITIPMWRWHVLTCHSNRLRRLVGNEQDTPAGSPSPQPPTTCTHHSGHQRIDGGGCELCIHLERVARSGVAQPTEDES